MFGSIRPMRCPRVLPTLLLLVACASTPPAPPAKRRPPCVDPTASVFGRDSEIGEAYGVGGLGLVAAAVPRPSHLDEPLEGAHLDDVHLDHLSLGQGGKSDALATFAIPSRAGLVLEGKTTVKGYGFKLGLGLSDRRRSFWVGCYVDRPHHVVDWSFTLRDQEGRASNTITVPVECTGQPIPGAAPHLDSVDLDTLDVLPGAHSNGRAHFSTSAGPVLITASTTVPGYGFRSTVAQASGEYRFFVC